MKNKKFGFEFWKGIAEVTSYSFIAMQFIKEYNLFSICASSLMTFYIIMMIVSEYKGS